jgi:hypothetical protein
VLISTLVMSNSNTHAKILGTAKVGGLSGYNFTVDVDIWNGINTSVSHKFTIVVTGPNGYSYNYSGDMDTGSAVSFLLLSKSAAAPMARSASTAAATDAALPRLLDGLVTARLGTRLGR